MIRGVSHSVLQLFDRPIAIPVATVDDPATAVELARSLARGGLDVLEITLRTPNAMQAVETVLREVPEIRVGVGTITTLEQLRQVAAAGAAFAVSPGIDEHLATDARDHEIPYMPGICTPSELMRALALGYAAVKVSPISTAGGVDLLRYLNSVFPAARFCPTGGIGEDNLREYLQTPGVFGAGLGWLAPADLVGSGDWPAIEERARSAAAICRQVIDSGGSEQ